MLVLLLGLVVTVTPRPVTGLGADAGEADKDTAEVRGALTSSGSFYVEWMPETGSLSLNEIEVLQVRVLDPENRQDPIDGAVVTVNARMPDHNHGLNLEPRVEMNENGSATVSGFLLHMEGIWEVEFGVALEGQMERARFEVDLQP